jgi:hypothetical protein
MSTSTIPRCHFDRSRIFYPLIAQYRAALIGFKEIPGHGCIRQARALVNKKGVSVEAAIAKVDPSGATLSRELLEHRGQFEVLPPLHLQSRVGSPGPIDAELMAEDLFHNALYTMSHLLPATAGALLISARERYLARDYCTKEPLWEFLRHCRHAAAHGNRFDFRADEPRRPAMWCGLSIEGSSEGTPLMQEQNNGPYFLAPGDPVQLLWDIEQAYPGLAA